MKYEDVEDDPNICILEEGCIVRHDCCNIQNCGENDTETEEWEQWSRSRWVDTHQGIVNIGSCLLSSAQNYILRKQMQNNTQKIILCMSRMAITF